jgi:hypothetical protein
VREVVLGAVEVARQAMLAAPSGVDRMEYFEDFRVVLRESGLREADQLEKQRQEVVVVLVGWYYLPMTLLVADLHAWVRLGRAK